MSGFKAMMLGDFLKPYRIEHRIQSNMLYKQVTISKSGNITLRGEKLGAKIGRKRQFKIDLVQYPNTIMFTRQGLLEGAIGIAPKLIDGCVVTENMPMMSVNTDIITMEYLRNLLLSNYFRNKVNALNAVGSAQKSIHESALLKVAILLPSLPEQAKMAKRIGKIESRAVLLEAELAKQQQWVAALRRQVLQEAVEGKLTAQWRTTHQCAPAAQLVDEITAHQKVMDGAKQVVENWHPQVKANPDWEMVELEELCDIKTGKRDVNHSTPDGQYPFFTCAAEQFKSPTFSFDGASILLPGNGANVGKVFYYDGKLEAYQRTYVLNKFKSKVLPKFVFYTLSSNWKHYIKNLQFGSATNYIVLGSLAKYKAPLPPVAEQRAIVARVDKLLALCEKLEAEITATRAHAAHLMPATLKEAFTPPA